MDKKDFVPFLETNLKLLQSNSRIRSRKVIKAHEEDLSHHSIRKFSFDTLGNHSPEIFIIEDEEGVRQIQFKCPCGCEATVNLEFGEENMVDKTAAE